MPPPLSDYDFTSDSDVEFQPQSAVTGDLAALQENQPTSTLEHSEECHQPEQAIVDHTDTKKKRKRSNLLVGLNMDNIITASNNENGQLSTQDAPPVSSAPASSYLTRGQANGMRASTPLYDQKYHPIDDVLQPLRAAKHRARYEEQYPDEESNENGLYEDAHIDSKDIQPESEYVQPESENPRPESGDFQPDSEYETIDSPNGNRTEMMGFSVPQGTRRSSRQVNRDVLYNTSVHPQDDDIEQMEVGNSQGEHATSEELSPEQTTANRILIAIVQGIRNNNEETASEWSTSSPIVSSPLSSIRTISMPPNNVRRGGDLDSVFPIPRNRCSPRGRRSRNQPFRIYEEPLLVQLGREAAAPEPIEHVHDDKENQIDDTDPELDSDPLDRITIQAASELGGVDAVLESHAFDGIGDNMDHAQAYSPSRFNGAIEADHPSIRGSLSPQRNSDQESVTGERTSEGIYRRDEIQRNRLPLGRIILYR